LLQKCAGCGESSALGPYSGKNVSDKTSSTAHTILSGKLLVSRSHIVLHGSPWALSIAGLLAHPEVDDFLMGNRHKRGKPYGNG
jgi:hypothetical protein